MSSPDHGDCCPTRQALAESDRLILPSALTDALELLGGMQRNQAVLAAPLTGVLDVMRGASIQAGRRRGNHRIRVSAAQLAAGQCQRTG